MRTVFAGGRVFDGTGAAVAEADVAVVDGQIVEVGVGLDGDEQIDVGGTTLLPGLFDTHVHVMFGHVDIWRHLQTPFSYRFFDAIKNNASSEDADKTAQCVLDSKTCPEAIGCMAGGGVKLGAGAARSFLDGFQRGVH